VIRIDGYLIDACISEEPSLESEITEYPVESGATITDHVRNLPQTLDLEFKVSDTPIGQAASARTAGAIPSSEARQFLETLRASRRTFTVITPRRTYESMVFRSLSFPRDGATGDALVGRASLQQLEIVNVRRVAVELQQKRKNVGRRPSTEFQERKFWLCPTGIRVSGDDAENRRNRCRVVIERNVPLAGPMLVDAETGVPLTTAEKEGMVINLSIPRKDRPFLRRKIVTFDETSGRWVNFSTGSPLSKETVTPNVKVPPTYQAPTASQQNPMDLDYWRRATGL
jgi:hypothetical protein